MTAENRASEREITNRDLQAEDVRLNQFAKQLGIQARGVTSIAKRIGILSPGSSYRTRVHFDRQEEMLIRETFNSMLTTDQVGTLIGLPQYQWGPLVKHGILKSVKSTSTKRNRGNRYLRSEVERLVADVLAGVPEGKRSYTVSLWTLGRHRNVTIGELAVLLVKRELAPVSYDSRKVGFSGLRFEYARSSPKGTSTNIPATRIPLVAVQAILGLKLCTVTWLATQEYFGTVVEFGLNKLVERGAVERFAAEYSDISVYGRILRVPNKHLLARLEYAGISSLHAANGNTLVPRAEADAVLGVDSRASEALTEKFGEYWRNVVDLVKRTCDTYRMPERLTRAGCSVRARQTSLRIMPIEENEFTAAVYQFSFATKPTTMGKIPGSP